MQTPRNRQEFLAMQQQAASAARDMQRRATLPMPSQGSIRNQEMGIRNQDAGYTEKRQSGWDKRPAFYDPPKPAARPEPLHHKPPSQKARQNASYSRTQPPIHNQEWQQPKPAQQQRRQEPQRNKDPHHRQQQPPRYQEPPPPSPPPPPQNNMPPLGDILSLLSGFGAKAQPKQQSNAFEPCESNDAAEGGMDSIMMILLLFLLQKENADQGLLMALMYIMM